MINKPPSPRSRKFLKRQLEKSIERLLADDNSLGDLKITSKTLKEMQRAFRVFAPYQNIRKISVFGSARTPEAHPLYELASRFSSKIADEGFHVITGAGPGIMKAAHEGAGRERSFGVNIQLPFEAEANSVIHGDPKLAEFNYFFTRKLFFVKEAHAVALFPGGFGTLDEGFEILTLLQTGKCQPLPVVLIDTPEGNYWKRWLEYISSQVLEDGWISREDLGLFLLTDDVDEAVSEIVRFYRVYHSSRYVRELLVIRLRRHLPDSYVADLEREFASILVDGGIEQRAAFPVERDEPEAFGLPRLVLHFDRYHIGKLRKLIDRINEAPIDGSAG